MMRFALAALMAAFAATAGAQPGHPAADLLRYAPAGTEVAVGVDVRALSNHPAFEQVYERLDTSAFDAGITALADVTGVHLFRDIEAIMLLGQLGDGGEGALLFRGSWDRPGLEEMVSWNATYRSEECAGRRMHIWRDEDDGKLHHAVFLADDILVMSEQKEVVRRVAETAGRPERAIARGPAAATIPPDAHAFLLAFRPEREAGDITKNPVLGKLAWVSLRLSAQERELAAKMDASALRASDAPHLARILEGFAAFIEMQDARSGESPWKTRTIVDGRRIRADIRVGMANVVEGAPRLQRLARAE